MNFLSKNRQRDKKNVSYASKTIIDAMFAFIYASASTTKDKTIATETIAIRDFISFILQQYPAVTEATTVRNITFLIQTYDDHFKDDDRIILKQAFKLVSDRLTDRDAISMICYEKHNGLVLDWTNPKRSKKLLQAIEHPKPTIGFLGNDMVKLAYKHAHKQSTQISESSVVIIQTLDTMAETQKEEPPIYIPQRTTPAPAGIVF